MSRRSRYSAFSSRKITHPVRNFFLGFAALLIALGLIVFAVNWGVTHQVTYERVSVTVPSLPDDLENWTILHLSDLHGETFGANQSGIAAAMGTVNVSSVVITGDMLGPDGEIEPLLQLIALLPADKPKLYLPGDEDPDYLDPTAHSSLSPKAAWAEKLEAAGVTILDAPVLFTRGKNDQARIWFIPAELYTLDLDSCALAWQSQLDRLSASVSLTADEVARKRVCEYQLDRVARIRQSISEIRSTDIQIAVSHVPVTSQEVSDALNSDSRSTVFSLRQASLILSGHWCGGQVRVPGIGALYVPGLGKNPDDSLLTGLQRTGTIPQHISAGFGSSAVYEWWQSKRFMTAPQVTCIALTRTQK